MNVDEMRGIGSEELLERLDEVKEEFFNLRFQNATGQLENHAQLKLVKREIARINTLVHEREIGIEIEPKPVQEVRKPRKTRSRKAKSDDDPRTDDSPAADADDDAGED